jgi:hypothetical protein
MEQEIMKLQDFKIDGKNLRLFPLNENYGVTIDGDVYSIVTQKWMNKIFTKLGYHEVSVKVPNRSSLGCFLHRIVLMTWGSMPPEGKNEVNHIDGNKLNNHVSNLQWNSRSENMLHGYKNGLCNAQKISIIERNKRDWAEGKKRNCVEKGALKRKELTGDKHEQSKTIINIKTNETIVCVRVLAEKLNIPYSSMRAKLNGRAKNDTDWRLITK